VAIKFSDEELVGLAEKWGKQDGEMSEDEIDGLEEDELYDIADDAWNFSGWMNFENHPELENELDELSAKSSELKLSAKYQDAFVKAISSK